MGYNTCHSMGIENATEEDRRKIIEHLDELGIIGYALDENFDTAYPCSWYDEPEQMEQVSLAFPHVHFIVHGEGDTNGDIWDHHYLNGMRQELYAQVIMPPLDPDKWFESDTVKDYRIKNSNLPVFEAEDVSELVGCVE